MSSFLLRANACSIHIRHEHQTVLNRLRMSYLPEPEMDLECTILGWADGSPIDTIRVSTNSETPLHTDIVLLHSATRLEMENFPTPRKFHTPPNDRAITTISEQVHLLAYNGLPSPSEDLHMYPNTSKKDVFSAYRNLYPDSLSWTNGPSEPGRYDANTVFYRISTFSGASGAGVFDVEGRLIGSSLLS